MRHRIFKRFKKEEVDGPQDYFKMFKNRYQVAQLSILLEARRNAEKLER